MRHDDRERVRFSGRLGHHQTHRAISSCGRSSRRRGRGALNGFTAERKRIEREQAAKGVLGGPVLSRCGTAAETSIKSFGAQVVPELLSVLEDVCGEARSFRTA